MAQSLLKICLLIFVLVCPSKQDEFFNFLTGLATNFFPLPLPEIYLTGPQIIKMYGFQCEIHKIRTEDDYILEIHRILPVRSDSPPLKKLPLLFIHGAASSSATWILNTPLRSLGFLFASAGYDVWLGNFRGTTYSSFHLTKPKSEKEFWDFSIDHYAIIDTPTMIDFVLNQTKEKKLIVIGHSTGSLSSIFMLANKTEYNTKVKSFASLSPVFNLKGMKNPLLFILLKFTDLLKMIGKNYEIYHLLPFPTAGFVVCRYFPILCYFTYLIINSGISSHTDVIRVPLFLSHLPDYMSNNVLEHLSQIHLSGQFRAFDYGDTRVNQRKYGTKIPPIYDIDKVQIPIGVFYGENDNLAGPANAFYMMKLLSNVTAFHKLPYDHFDHFLAFDVQNILFPNLKLFVDKSCEDKK